MRAFDVIDIEITGSGLDMLLGFIDIINLLYIFRLSMDLYKEVYFFSQLLDERLEVGIMFNKGELSPEYWVLLIDYLKASGRNVVDSSPSTFEIEGELMYKTNDLTSLFTNYSIADALYLQDIYYKQFITLKPGGYIIE